jgi:hypothetical protein
MVLCQLLSASQVPDKLTQAEHAADGRRDQGLMPSRRRFSSLPLPAPHLAIARRLLAFLARRVSTCRA